MKQESRCSHWGTGCSGRLQMTGQKLDLVAHQCLEWLSEVEVEMAGVVTLDLATRSGARVPERLCRRRHTVGVADAEQDWEFDLLRHAPGPVGHDRRCYPCRYLVPESRL